MIQQVQDSVASPLRVAGVLLAAGESRRMGGPNKLAIQLDGVPLVRRTAQTLLAAGIDPLIVVLGHAADTVAALLHDLPVRCVVNEAYQQGQQRSVLAGLAALDPARDGAPDALLVSLSDLPLLSADALRELIQAFAQRGEARVQVPVHQGQRGNPVMFEAGLLEALLACPGGPREWIDSHPQAVRRLSVSHPGFTTDLDTADDIAELSRRPDAPRVIVP